MIRVLVVPRCHIFHVKPHMASWKIHHLKMYFLRKITIFERRYIFKRLEFSQMSHVSFLAELYPLHMQLYMARRFSQKSPGHQEDETVQACARGSCQVPCQVQKSGVSRTHPLPGCQWYMNTTLTLPKTKISAENRPGPKRKPDRPRGTIFFRGELLVVGDVSFLAIFGEVINIAADFLLG